MAFGKAIPYREALGSVEGLRRGFTTGTTACAACAAAARMLAEGETVRETAVKLPGKGPFGGTELMIPVEVARQEGGAWTAGVRKDAGDDDDSTDGILILCRARYLRSESPSDTLRILAGEGIGRVTRPGLPVPVGEAAINPIPRGMIREAAGPYEKPGFVLELTLSAPEGEKIARETWNPRLGVEGGISLIGTSGVVEPKSAKAFQASIALCIRQAALLGKKRYVVTLGHVGAAFLESRGLGQDSFVAVGDHVGFALERCRDAGMEEIVLAGHVGKLAKVAAGIFDTHWRTGDARLETLAACAAACGARRETVRELLSLGLAEAAEEVLRREKLEETYRFLAARAVSRMEGFFSRKGKGGAKIGCAVLSLRADLLGVFPEELAQEESWRSFR